jgi:hypothetical protein
VDKLSATSAGRKDGFPLFGTVTAGSAPLLVMRWSILENSDRVAEIDVFAVDATRPTMVLDLSALMPGGSYSFQLQAWDKDGLSCKASVDVIVNSPPRSGTLSVEPRTGVVRVGCGCCCCCCCCARLLRPTAAPGCCARLLCCCSLLLLLLRPPSCYCSYHYYH